MESFDVVIVGAGPAGLNCAETLAKAGKSVLLLEQNKLIGPKVCAGGLQKRDVKYLKLPERLLGCRFNSITIHTPFNKDVITSDEPFVYTVERKDLGQWQLKNLKKTDATVRTESRVTKIAKSHVVVNDSKKIGFKHLVGADGSSSIVRRHVGLKTRDLDIAIQYLIPTKRYKEMEVFLDSELFHSWYAWIFPHKDYVSIGCGSDPRFLPINRLKENFNRWLESNRIDVSEGEYQAHSLNFDFQGYRFKNVFLIGDAAGLVSGLTGEGIYQALISGEEIAKIIIDENYVSEKMKQLIAEKRLHNKILHFLEKSGRFRKAEYELLALLMKSKLIDRKLIRLLG